MRLIETGHLRSWSDSQSARATFPYLVKKLISAIVRPDHLRMPSGDAVWVPGADGVILCQEGNEFVPTGLSMWELSTDGRIATKATRDYRKRSNGELKVQAGAARQETLNRSQVTFVFVTPRVWKAKDEWVMKHNAEKLWRNVMAIDGVDLQEWIESAPAVSLQFAADLGLVPEAGLETPEQAWDSWSTHTDPPASEELVTAGRADQEKELIERLVGPPTTFCVRGDSPRAAWGFVLSTIRRIESSEDRMRLLARTVVAQDEEVAQRLRNLTNLIIVLRQAKGQVPGVLSSSGCHVIIPEGNDAHTRQNVIELPRPSQRAFSEALAGMGLSSEEAERATRACGLSVTILQRQRAQANHERPAWAESAMGKRLLPALLAGRWNGESEADQSTLCDLADTADYSRLEDDLEEYLIVDEPPLQRVGSVWALTAPADAFQLLARLLTQNHLRRFRNAFQVVFARIDPKVELPPDEWIYQDLNGNEGHSGWLRSGMAETLLLIAERGPDAQLRHVRARDYAEEVVQGLPGLNDDWRVLASLTDELPRLIEAAPHPFFSSLERWLEANPGELRRIFAEGDALFGGGAKHTGLLWGLERVAWSSDFLPRVALILAGLAAIDPGGQLSNRPINSLREVFLWWHPGTNASAAERFRALDAVLEKEPTIGWELLTRLVPAAPSMSHETAKPRWSNFGDLPEESRKRAGQLRYLSGLVDRALQRVNSVPERWKTVLRALRGFTPHQQEVAVKLLSEIAQGALVADERKAFWELLRDFINQQRRHPLATWALPGNLLARLEEVLPLLAPVDPVERHRWLFDRWLPDLPSEQEDLQKHKDLVESLREKAVRDIANAGGTEALVDLGTSCELPGIVADVAIRVRPDLNSCRQLLVQATLVGDKAQLFAAQVSKVARSTYGDEWAELVRDEARANDWTPEMVANILTWWPEERATWTFASSFGEEVEEKYWHCKPIFEIVHDLDDQDYQVKRLVAAGRASKALEHISYDTDRVPTNTIRLLFEYSMRELAAASSAESFRGLSLGAHHVRRVLDVLRKRRDMPREELARYEYRALPLLGSLDSRGLTIHEFIAQDPGFFVDVICDVYLPRNRDKSKDAEPTPETQARGQAGFTILRGMDRVPGQEKDEVDGRILREWIRRAREKAGHADRAIVADLTIGEILAHAPNDPRDGGWPHRSVRDIVEDLCTEEIERGLIMGRFNMRGVVSKALYEGGEQERALAEQYREWAAISRVKWPRMARVLEKAAKGWERDAEREDTRAEQDKLTDS